MDTKEMQEAGDVSGFAGMEFSTDERKVPVKIDGEDYEIRELDGETKGAYLNSVGKRAIINPDTGKCVGMRNFVGMEESLLCRCLYRAGEEKPVEMSILTGWPSTVLEKLFIIASKLSGLTNEAQKQIEEEAKND